MNREDRRALKKSLKNKKMRTLAANILESIGNDINDVILDGEQVVLNIERITGRDDYSRMQEGYRKFVEESHGKVFVAHPHRPRPDGFSTIIELEGVDDWLFWYGDLIRVENIPAEEGE